MSRAPELTAERLRALLDYDPLTGVFTRRVTQRRWRAGQVAGGLNAGYVRIVCDRRNYTHGEMPQLEIDHINGIRNDNRIANLREASPAEQRQNHRVICNSSGFTGVNWYKRIGKWRAHIKIDRHQIHLGYFSDKEQAHAAYVAAKARLHTFQPVQRL